MFNGGILKGEVIATKETLSMLKVDILFQLRQTFRGSLLDCFLSGLFGRFFGRFFGNCRLSF